MPARSSWPADWATSSMTGIPDARARATTWPAGCTTPRWLATGRSSRRRRGARRRGERARRATPPPGRRAAARRSREGQREPEVAGCVGPPRGELEAGGRELSLDTVAAELGADLRPHLLAG